MSYALTSPNLVPNNDSKMTPISSSTTKVARAI